MVWGQASRAEDLAATAVAFNNGEYPPFPADSAIGEGALVEVAFGRESDWFLLAPAGGGLSIEIDGAEITVLSPETPLRKQLAGLRVGGKIAERNLTVKGVY